MSGTTEDARKARREADRQKAREAVQALQSSDGWKQWLAARRHFRRYSLANQLLIALQRPEATRVAPFRAWLKLGYCVRRGERALRIWVPVPRSQRTLERWRAEGEDPVTRPGTHFKLGAVFDRAQVDPLPPPAQPVPLDPPIVSIDGEQLAWAFPPLIALAGELGSTVTVEAMNDSVGGYYDVATRRIAINQANSINQQAKTLVHELGHALLRAQHAEDHPGLSYAAEELVVESVAFTVCGAMGIDTAGYSVPYLASWAELAELEVIEQAATTIDRIAKRIEEALETTLSGFLALP
jgi:antirestriction protein ArdC